MDALKLAVVGCGGIGLTHIRALSKIDGVEVAACVDLDKGRAAKGAEICGGAAIGSLDELPEDLDGATVATSPQTHYPIAKRLLEKGLDVFCEKPLTMRTEECRELDALAKRQGLNLMAGFKMRHEPVFAKAKELLPSIGKLICVSTVKQQPYSPRPENNWFPKVGAMFELSVHDFDLVHWIAGLRPEKVLHAKLSHRLGWEREDAFNVCVEYSGGVVGMLQGMYSLDSKFMFRDFCATFSGEAGYMRVERPDRVVVHTDKFEVHQVDPGKANAFEEELKAFCRAIRGEAPCEPGAQAGTDATFIAEEAFKLSMKGN